MTPERSERKFRVGRKVLMTDAAIKQGLDGPRHILSGTVIAFHATPHLVRVRRDGHSLDETWHMDFWKPAR